MKTYRLKRDLPIGRAGTIWHTNNTHPIRAYLTCDGEGISVLRELIHDWWEEIVGMKPFTREQRDSIVLWFGNNADDHLISLDVKMKFYEFLDKNTEQV